MNTENILLSDKPAKFHFIRLHRGDDIMECIKEIASRKNIQSGTVVSSVGCISEGRIRAAGGVRIEQIKQPCEILSINGTVSCNRCHLHICLSKEDLTAIGGHLCPGCIVNTTCELIICEFADIAIASEYDPETGYNEASFQYKNR